MRYYVVVIVFLFASWAHAQQRVSNQMDSVLRVARIDSLQQPLQQLDSLEHAFHQKADSLQKNYQQSVGRLQAQQQHLRQQRDSLSALQLPTDKILKQQDSITHKLNTTVTQYQEKVTQVQQRFNDEVNAVPLPPELKGAVDKVSTAVNSFALPDASGIAPDFSLPQQPNLNLDGVKLPDGLNTESLTTLPGTDQLQEQLPDVAGMENIENVKALTEVKSVDDAAAALAEEQAANLKEVKAIQGQGGELQQLQSLTSEDAAKEMLQQEAMKQIPRMPVNHFAGKEAVLQRAMEDLAKLKNKYYSLENLDGLKKKRPNEMRGKPFIERLRPGVALQILTADDAVLVDFNVYVGYRFTGRLAAGPGWVQRVDFNTRDYNFRSVAAVYGPRFFGEYNVWKNFCPRLEGELLNTHVPPVLGTQPSSEGNREWVWGILAGVKKDYRIASRIRGMAQVMIYVAGPKYKRPYPDVLNTRVGLEFQLRKRSAKSKQITETSR